MLCLGLAVANLYAVEPASGPPLSKQRYDTIVSHLDTGGDLLLVANLDGYLKRLVDDLLPVITALAEDSAQTNRVQNAVAKIPGFLDKNGFYAFQGFGLSVAPRPDGLKTLKCFVARDPAAAGAPLWRCAVGGEPRKLASTAFLSADTVLAASGTGEWPKLWEMVRAGVTEFATPEGAAAFERSLSQIATKLGVPLDRAFESLGGESFFALHLSRTATMEIPTASEAPIKIPRPSFLIGLAVRDATLANAIETSLASAKTPVLKTECEGAEVSSVSLGARLPFPLEPAFAVYSNFFLLGSAPSVVTAAIESFNRRDGIVATAEFKAAFQGLPEAGNGLSYMSPRFMRTLMEIQTAALDRPGAKDGKQIQALLHKLFGLKPDAQSAYVEQNLEDGVLTVGTTTASGTDLVGGALLVPVGILSAIALPSFAKARGTAQNNACINNLRILDAAKEQWAMENRKVDGDPADIPGVLEYVKGARMPVCPRGGSYQIGTIGQTPRCSVPGHRLPQ
jgi:hypothetical protein